MYTEDLLNTKLYIPPTRSEIVSRPRLIEKLNNSLHRKLTCISAPAGFGKKTLDSEWVEMQPDLVSLDARLFGEEILTTITKIWGEWPKTQCVVLTESDVHRQSAQDSGADFVVPEGFPAARLVIRIEDLLSQKSTGEFPEKNKHYQI
ncbi:MAG: hypothetical protein ACERK9_07205 [Deltaproteobacteria bacterium]